MSKLGDRLLAIDRSLTRAGLPHAFGGAIALAYCTKEPRGTRDIDVNVFVPAGRASDVLAGLPEQITIRRGDRDVLARDEQVRLMWDDTPVDIFLEAHDFHRKVAKGVRTVPFEGETIAVLSCTALAVFKVMFGRTKDWADIEAMLEAGMNGSECVRSLSGLLGPDDPRVVRLRSLFQ